MLDSTRISLTWAPPPSSLTSTLTSYQIQYGTAESPQSETLQHSDLSTLSSLFVGLEEATQYQFSVFGVYVEGVRGVEVMVTAMTAEDGESQDSAHEYA